MYNLHSLFHRKCTLKFSTERLTLNFFDYEGLYVCFSKKFSSLNSRVKICPKIFYLTTQVMYVLKCPSAENVSNHGVIKSVI